MVGIYKRFLDYLYPRTLQSRPPRPLQVLRTLERAGRLAAPLGMASRNLRIRPAAHPQDRRQAVRVRRHDPGRHPGLLSRHSELRCPALRLDARSHPRGRQRSQSPASVPRDGHPPADALPRLRGLLGALRFRAGRAHDALSRREVDQDHARLDHGYLAVPHLRHLPRHALGLCGARLGRLLGMGSG